MLKTLLKKQMAEIFRNYFYDPKKNKMRSKGATAMYIALYVLLMAGVLGGMFALLAVGICAPMAAAGVGWLYYLVMGLIAVLLGAFGSVFSTYSSLYLSKDNDLLLSMPIPVRYVMASRLLGVYLLGLMYSGVATVPAVSHQLLRRRHGGHRDLCGEAARGADGRDVYVRRAQPRRHHARHGARRALTGAVQKASQSFAAAAAKKILAVPCFRAENRGRPFSAPEGAAY